jgi:hypothetical protein
MKEGDPMNESQLLNETLERISHEGTHEAYTFLVDHLDRLEDKSSQVYNFLYCLAATSDKPNEALDWMAEAIETKGLWYRPEVFEDEDLDSIREHARFTKYLKLSQARFEEEKNHVKPIFTWQNKTSDNLITVLHGNQQNNNISESYWSKLNLPNYQIAYLQSEEIDSYQLYRWEDEGSGPLQLQRALESIPWDTYDQRVLSGFSAGCNTILRGLSKAAITCDKIILQSPWMPCIDTDLEDIMRHLTASETEILLICGDRDEDCMPQCLRFEAKAKAYGLKIDVHYIDGLGHDYPDNFEEIVSFFCRETATL